MENTKKTTTCFNTNQQQIYGTNQDNHRRISSNDRPSPKFNGVPNDKPKIGVTYKKQDKIMSNNPEEHAKNIFKHQY